MMKRFALAGFAAAMLSVAGVAQAATIVYSFDATQVGGFGTGPYGTVTLTESGSDVLFNVSLRSDLDFVNTGSKSVFSFNANGVATTDVTNILFAGFPNANYLVFSPGVNAPFGTVFSLMIDCPDDDPDCKNGAPGKQLDPLTFTVLGSTLADFGFNNIDVVLDPSKPNKKDSTTAFFAADVICVNTLSSGCTSSGATGAIGVSSNSSTSSTSSTSNNSNGQVPDGSSSLSLLGLGLVGLGFLRRRKMAA